MYLIRGLTVALAVAFSVHPALADDDPPKCTVTQIKGTDVSIDIPLRGKLVTELHCRTDAMKAAKEYARSHPVCDPKKKIEKTFKLSIEFGTRASHKSITMTTGCP